MTTPRTTPAEQAVTPVVDDDGVAVTAAAYRWRWRRDSDRFTLRDDHGRQVVTGPLAPVVVTAAGAVAPGPARHVRAEASRLIVEYDALTVALRFEQQALWFEPVECRVSDPVVEVYHFGRIVDGRARPGLRQTYLIQPGLSETASLSPIVPTAIGLDVVSWLGRGSMGHDSQLYQQWGLPAHYFAGVHRDAAHNAAGSATRLRSAAYCCGLAELPDADLLLHLADGAVSPVFRVRADLWRHTTAERLGAELVFTFGADFRAAIASYYRILRERGRVRPAPGRRAATLTQFNTWGAQCAAGAEGARFDQTTLETIYEQLRASPLRPEMFVIDDKWEGSYGTLSHSPQRFPRFEQFLDRVRADGMRVGLWAAFLRTNDPATLGLRAEHLMRDAAGRPITKPSRFESAPYHLLDVSQPQVAAALTERIRRFVARYDPDLVKFDFGYELPSLSLAAPADPAYAGERLLGRALSVVADALHAAKPDIALMYYSLSPLLADRIDQHCHDDLYLCVDDYAAEGNRRLFFSSLLGEFGIPSYGSAGYDWASAADIWFDTVAAGPIGSLAGVDTDEADGHLTPALAALHTGLTAIARRGGTFRVEPVGPVTLGGITGARSRSWLRYEHDALTLACLRAEDGNVLHRHGISTDTDLVVASLTGAPLKCAERIGVVAFRPGALRITTDHPLRITHHLLDASRRVDVADHRDGAVQIPLDTAGNPPKTWIEIARDPEVRTDGTTVP